MLESLTFDLETLCLAAELITALLLVSLIPVMHSNLKNRTKSDAGYGADLQDNQSDEWVAWLRGAKVESLLFAASSDIERLPQSVLKSIGSPTYEHLTAIGWEDRVTGVANRAMLEAVLQEVIRWPQTARPRVQVTSVAISNHSALLQENGALEVEMLLREVGSLLKEQAPADGLVTRFQPDRFLILHLRCATQTLNGAALQKSIDERIASAGRSFACNLVACTSSAQEEVRSLDALADLLEEGIQSAIEQSIPHATESLSGWSALEETEPTDGAEPSQTNSMNGEGTPSTQAEADNLLATASDNFDDDIDDNAESPDSTNSTIASIQVSGVTAQEDAENLLAEINRLKQETSQETNKDVEELAKSRD